MLAHVPSFGRNPWGSPDFLAYPVPKACMHVLCTRVPRRLGVARSASSPKAAQALGCSLTPGLRISFGRVTCMARAASVPGLWALGFLLSCGVCVWVRLAVGCGFCLPRQSWLGSWVGVFGHGLWCCPSSVGCLWCSWLGFGFGLLLGRVWFCGRPACPPPFPVPARGVGVFAGPGSRLCPALLGWVVGVCFFFFALWFFLFFFFFFFWLCGPCPSIPFLLGWAGGSLFFFSFFLCPFSPWSAVTGLVLPVLGGWSPCASVGVLFFFFFFSRCLLGGGLAACGLVGGRLGGCGLFSCLFPFPPPFFFGGGGACLFLPLPSLGWRTHWPAFSVVFRAAVFSCVLCGHVPAPWVAWAVYTVGSAPLLAGLGPGSAGWAAAPGGFLWFWVRGLGLFVSLPLCGAGCNLLGGPSPLSPGALWPRVWLAVLVCGVVARRLPGCAVAGFG